MHWRRWHPAQSSSPWWRLCVPHCCQLLMWLTRQARLRQPKQQQQPPPQLQPPLLCRADGSLVQVECLVRPRAVVVNHVTHHLCILSTQQRDSSLSTVCSTHPSTVPLLRDSLEQLNLLFHRQAVCVTFLHVQHLLATLLDQVHNVFAAAARLVVRLAS